RRVRQRHLRHLDRRARRRLHLHRLEWWRLLRHRHLHRHDECGHYGDRHVCPSDLHAHRELERRRERHHHQRARRHRLRHHLRRRVRQRHRGHLDRRAGCWLDLLWLERRRLLRHRHLHRHGECGHYGDRHVCPSDLHAHRELERRWDRHHHQRARRHRLRHHLRRRVRQRHLRHLDRRARRRLHLLRLEWRRLLRHRHLHRHDECGHHGDRHVCPSDLHAIRELEQRWDRHHHQRARRHRLRHHLRRRVRQRHRRHLDRRARRRLHLHRLEWWRLLRHRHLHRHDECGHYGDRHVCPSDLHAHREPERRRDRHHHQRARRHLLRRHP